MNRYIVEWCVIRPTDGASDKRPRLGVHSWLNAYVKVSDGRRLVSARGWLKAYEDVCADLYAEHPAPEKFQIKRIFEV